MFLIRIIISSDYVSPMSVEANTYAQKFIRPLFAYSFCNGYIYIYNIYSLDFILHQSFESCSKAGGKYGRRQPNEIETGNFGSDQPFQLLASLSKPVSRYCYFPQYKLLYQSPHIVLLTLNITQHLIYNILRIYFFEYHLSQLNATLCQFSLSNKILLYIGTHRKDSILENWIFGIEVVLKWLQQNILYSCIINKYNFEKI